MSGYSTRSRAGTAALAEATSLLHIATTANGLRALLASEEGNQPGEAREHVPLRWQSGQ